MEKPRSFIHYRVGNETEYGALHIGTVVFSIPVMWTAVAMATFGFVLWGAIGGAFFVGFGVSFLPLMWFGIVFGALVALILVASLISWMIKEVQEDTSINREKLGRL